jgi:hypothetical protein
MLLIKGIADCHCDTCSDMMTTFYSYEFFNVFRRHFSSSTDNRILESAGHIQLPLEHKSQIAGA